VAAWCHNRGVRRIVLDALTLLAAGGLAVLALPREQIAPDGIRYPSPGVIALGVLSVLVLLVGVVAAAHTGQLSVAWLGLLLVYSVLGLDALSSTALPAVVSSVAALLTFTAAPAVVQMSLGWPTARPHHTNERLLATAAWVCIAGTGVVWLLVWNPYSDVTCVLSCGDNPLGLISEPVLARNLIVASQIAIAVSCSLTAAVVLRPSRFWPGGLAALMFAVDAVVRLGAQPPLESAVAVWLYQLRSSVLIVLGLAMAVSASQRIRRHRRLLRLAESIEGSPTPGTFAISLREVLDDPYLAIAYPVTGSNSFVLADGKPFTGPTSEQVTTRIVRDGVDVAVIAHRPQDAGAISSGIGAAATLAIDNERIAADMRARLAELRLSRERIVERSDAERLLLERDVHDGAQQRLLMLGHELRSAVRLDPALSSDLVPVIEDVDEALAELRDVAHGIYPGILESYGLRAALDSLSDGPVRLVVRGAPTDRLPARVERAAYRVIDTAVRSRLGSEAVQSDQPLITSAVIDAGVLRVKVEGVTGLARSDFEALEDHVGALGGAIDVQGTTLDCEIPCV
jgi:signal transduction histidine kinase